MRDHLITRVNPLIIILYFSDCRPKNIFYFSKEKLQTSEGNFIFHTTKTKYFNKKKKYT